MLHDSFKGAEIDDHEMVIRINNAMPKNINQTMVKAHVGAKTTLSFMNSHILQQCLKKFGYCNCHTYGKFVHYLPNITLTNLHSLDSYCLYLLLLAY